MKKVEYLFLCLLIFICFGCKEKVNKKEQKEEEITVACYYFPNYHTGDPKVEAQKGKGWMEWELVKKARPRFEGHQQPKVPVWGYTDESNPKAMAQKIDAAADHGIDVFLFDWYYYDDGPYLNRGLDEGFLKADNTNKLKFALMWANHDWVELHPATHGTPQELLYPGKISPSVYEQICDHVIQDYFTKPNYWLIDGKAYFSIYDIQRFVESFGSIEATRAAMDMMRDKAIQAGLKGVHWNIVTWGNPILPVEVPPNNYEQLIDQLGFDSATSYVWIHHSWPGEAKTDYNKVRDEYLAFWDKAKAEYNVPYYPNITMGWDSSPRTNQDKDWDPAYGYPYSGVLYNNTPQNFKDGIELIKSKLLADPNGPRIVNINCWNEWTEGSYLEPDEINGMQYLEAVKDVFGNN